MHFKQLFCWADLSLNWNSEGNPFSSSSRHWSSFFFQATPVFPTTLLLFTLSDIGENFIEFFCSPFLLPSLMFFVFVPLRHSFSSLPLISSLAAISILPMYINCLTFYFICFLVSYVVYIDFSNIFFLKT